MKAFRFVSSWALLVLLTLVAQSAFAQETGKDFKERGDEIRERAEWFYRQRAYPLESKAAPSDRTSANLSWTLVGPRPSTPFPHPFAGSQTVAGRVTALAIDPTNPRLFYLGAADGGVWKTTDGGTNWTPLTDTQASLSVGSIALDPSNHNTIYVGTREDNYAAGGSMGDENNLFHPEAPRAHKGAHPERPNEILA